MLRLITLALSLYFSINLFATESVKFRGEITEKQVTKVLNKLHGLINEGSSEIKVELSSDGGDLGQAFRFVRELRALNSKGNHIMTSVKNFCGSACTVMYLGGIQRWACPGARFMFHSPRVTKGQGLNNSEIKALEDRYRVRWLKEIERVDPELAIWLEEERAFYSDHETIRRGNKLDTGYVTDLHETERLFGFLPFPRVCKT